MIFSRSTSSYVRGFSLIEALLASALFGLIATGAVGALLYSQESVAISGDRARALMLAHEGLEAARNIRDSGFENLVMGTWGLSLASNEWSFVASPDVTDIFTRTVTIASVDSSTRSISSTLAWQSNLQRPGSITLVTQLSNWRTVTQTQADQVAIDASGAVISGSGKSELQGIELSNTGTSTVVIDRVTVSWTKPNQNIKEIKMEGTVVWSNNGPGTPTGTQGSGTELDIQDISIPALEDDFDIDRIKMTGNAEGDTFTIVLRFTDGSSKQFFLTPAF